MDTQTLTHQLNKLISYNTVSPNTSEIRSCMKYIQTHLCSSSTCHIKQYESDSHPILIVSTHNTKTPDVAFLCHIDVVSAPVDLLRMKEHGGKFYGRGVSDMKFSIPVCADILRSAQKAYPNLSLSLILTSDEEHGGKHGAGYVANTLKYRPKLLFVPDGGNNWELVSHAKGVLQVTITVTGTSAHASRPWEGVSANDRAISLLSKLRELYRQPKKKSWNAITMNVGVLNGGNSINQIPNACVIKLDFRYPNKNDGKAILSAIKNLLKRNDSLSVFHANAFVTDVRNPDVKKFLSISEKIIQRKIPSIKEYGASDARYFSVHKVPCVVLKPDCGGEHADSEWMSCTGIIQFHKAIQTYLESGVTKEKS